MVRPLLAALAASFLLASTAAAESRPPAATSAGPAASRSAPQPVEPQWIQVHRRTGLWSKADKHAELFRMVEPGAKFRLALPPNGPRLYVFDPDSRNYAFIDAADIGPIDGRKIRLGEDRIEPGKPNKGDDKSDKTDRMPTVNVFWSGTARVTMYTCVELGGCNFTASGVWPYEGVVAVDPRLVPLGSTVWIEGLGTFLAADTGSAVRGAHFDVYVYDYRRAINWGIRYIPAAAYRP